MHSRAPRSAATGSRGREPGRGRAATRPHGLDWLAGMGESNIVEFGADREGEPSLRRIHRARGREMPRHSLPDIVTVFETLLGAADRACCTRSSRTSCCRASRTDSPTASTAGSTTTSRSSGPGASTCPRIDRPVLLLHGADDRFVPIAHGRWLAERVPGVEARLTGDEDGHLTLIARRVREVHEWLLAH